MSAQDLTPLFQNKTVIVTGGAGFIGSHLCEWLIAAGAHVIAVDNFLTGNAKNIQHLSDQLTFVQANAYAPANSYLPPTLKPDLILHFASPASPPTYQKYPIETYLVNSLGTHHLLQYLHQQHPQARFLFASTSEVYGDPQQHPQTETYWGNVNPNGVRSCYDEAKRLGETICGVHARDFAMDVRIVRIFNTYGPRMDINDGRIIPNFIHQSMQHQPLTLFGDGSQTRSFCYVDDLVEGILRFAGSDVDQLRGQTINLGNEEEYTALDTAKIIHEEMKHRLKQHEEPREPFVFQPLPQDDPTRRRPDITKARQLLNWQPQIDFKTGLGRTIDYFLEAEQRG